ncbi:hypothetical protein M409DRAFT_37286 [Zasmidium cellare ATCC 36951]|uniref:PRISE-like Rossmann-fold domain-containing protein n=1 Tax=Zasmidium cellare ATCC 36951 TaxID=1080233 RepID=A0A6A6C883_ZASCE|nr:uncharacterized protein M409DRAFT_37286 [Zasmidium cellare ATCC 36951]KAF2163354.1 hypothetical protein M409DRAFT_37286 [Zasmidium cellare ATCC 36951]
MMSVQQVQSKGIYHALPVYPSEVSGLTAIITGANGISGNYLMRVLAANPERWSRIICLSRRPPLIPGGLPNHVEHIPLDFLKDPKEIATTLKEHNVTADHVFFFSYIQPTPKEGAGLWSNAEELVKVNSELLENFLQALKVASIKPKRFMLQTGAKNYGGHLGPTKIPQEETDPRVELEPNFYYPQEDLLWKFCEENGVGWSVHMPGPIVGAVPDAAMNCAYPLAVYAAVCKHKGQPFEFPGDVDSWQMPNSMSAAQMNAYQEEWAVLLGPPNQKYNTCDNSSFSWEKGWPRIAGWYGIEAKGPQDGDKYTETETRFVPRGYGPKGVTRRKFRLVDWAKKPEVQQAWRELVKQHDLTQDLHDIDRVFGFLDGTLCRPAPLYFSMDKSRKLGWQGFVDSSEAMLEVFQDLAKLKMIPPVPLVHVSFN